MSNKYKIFDIFFTSDAKDLSPEYAKHVGQRIPAYLSAKSSAEAQRRAEEWLSRNNDRADSFGRNGLGIRVLERIVG